MNIGAEERAGQAEDRFRLHPAAGLVGPEGAFVAAPGPVVIPPRPAAAALRQALAVAGRVFRIGGGSAVPEPGPVPMLETLTSGTSGAPRRIRRSQRSWLASFAVNAGLFGIGPGVRVAVPGGLEQSLALYAALEGLHLGAEVHLLEALRPDRQRDALRARAIGVLYATPTQVRLLVEAGGAECPALRCVVVGGAKLDAGLRAALAGLAPAARVREFYGAAEASFITLSDDTTPPDSVGRPYPGVEIAVRGEGGAPLPDGETGEIWVRSPYLFEGYAGAAEGAGAARWRDGWLSVGEMGHLAGGALFLAGRAGRMVTVADTNVFPEAIEAFLQGLPGVRRAAVIARPDPLRGHVLDAVLQGDPAAEAAVLAAARARFGPLAAPRRAIWRGDWPELPSGKTDLRALAEGGR